MLKSIITLVLLCVIGFFYLSEIDSIDQSESVINSPDCILTVNSCSVLISENQTLTINLNPKPLEALKPLSLKISGQNKNDVNFKVWFEGRDMFMGQHYLIPENIDLETQETLFSGMLPVCTSGEEMIWRLNIEFSHKSEKKRIQFDVKPH